MFENFSQNEIFCFSSLPQFIQNENKLFAQPSVKEIQTSRQVANIEITEEDKPNKFENTLFLHYTHEKLLDPLKRDIYKTYSDVSQGPDASNIRLIIEHRKV